MNLIAIGLYVLRNHDCRKLSTNHVVIVIIVKIQKSRLTFEWLEEKLGR